MAGIGRLRDDELIEGLKVGYLKFCGWWDIVNDYRENGLRSVRYQIWMWWTIIWFTPLFVVSAMGPFYTTKDLEGLTVVLLNPMSATQTVVKFGVIWYGIDVQARLMDLMKKDCLPCVPPEKREDIQTILRKWAKRSNFLAYAGCYINFVTIQSWNILPILRSEFVRCSLGITVFGKPSGPNKILGFWYPVNLNETPWTQIIYFYELGIGLWAAFIITLYEALLVQLVTLLSGNMEAIQFLLSDMKTSCKSKPNTQQLVEYIKGHQFLIRVGEEMRILYHFLITMQLITATAILIMTIFNFFLGSNKGDVVLSFKFVIFSMYALTEVCIYCYAGSKLEHISSDVGFAAYDSDWYKMGPEFRKTLHMVIIRARNPVDLKAAWVPVNYSALTTILQMAYSTSMFMNRVING